MKVSKGLWIPFLVSGILALSGCNDGNPDKGTTPPGPLPTPIPAPGPQQPNEVKPFPSLSYNNESASRDEKNRLVLKDPVFNMRTLISNFDQRTMPVFQNRTDGNPQQKLPVDPYKLTFLFGGHIDAPEQAILFRKDLETRMEFQFGAKGELTFYARINGHDYRGHNIPYLFDKSTGELAVGSFYAISGSALNDPKNPLDIIQLRPSRIDDCEETLEEVLPHCISFSSNSPSIDLTKNNVTYTGPAEGWYANFHIEVALFTAGSHSVVSFKAGEQEVPGGRIFQAGKPTPEIKGASKVDVILHQTSQIYPSAAIKGTSIQLLPF